MNDLDDTRMMLDSYPCQSTLSVRYGDLDADGLIGDIAIARYVEQARSRLMIDAMVGAGIGIHSGTVGMLIASLRIEVIEHRAPGHEIVLASGVSRSGRSSVDVRVALFSGGVCLAVSDNVMVIIARESGRPIAQPDALRTQLERYACRVALTATSAE
jgi:acyl-CoA thioester hydrolase